MALPARLKSPRTGRAWARAARVRSSDALDEMRQRYSKLGRQLPLMQELQPEADAGEK